MAKIDPIPADATLASVRDRLSKPVLFIPAVYGVANRAEKDEGPVQIRLGVTGTGKTPNYRLERSDGSVIETYDGAKHTLSPEGDETADGAAWSSAAMSFSELRDLLQSVRDHQKAAR